MTYLSASFSVFPISKTSAAKFLYFLVYNTFLKFVYSFRKSFLSIHHQLLKVFQCFFFCVKNTFFFFFDLNSQVYRLSLIFSFFRNEKTISHFCCVRSSKNCFLFLFTFRMFARAVILPN